MERHELDVVSLVVGTLFVVFGLAVVFGGFDAFATGRGWLLPGTLIGLGALIAAVALNRELRRSRNELPETRTAETDAFAEEPGEPD